MAAATMAAGVIAAGCGGPSVASRRPPVRPPGPDPAGPGAAPVLRPARSPGPSTGWNPAGLSGTMPAAGTCRWRTAADGSALPDPVCTPGAVDATVNQANIRSTICAPGWASAVRPPEALTQPAKHRAMAAYGLAGPASGYEYDHLVPLELGGSSDLANLWPEPDTGSPSAFDSTDGFGENAKDGVEDRLHSAVCTGQTTLTDAQQAIVTDWTTAEAVLGLRP